LLRRGWPCTPKAVPFLAPAAVCYFLARQSGLSPSDAHQALERLRPLIRREQYEAARRDLETL